MALGAWCFSAADAAEPTVRGKPLSEIATSSILTPATSYWAGEIFSLTHETRVVRGSLTSVSPEFAWTPPGVILEDWSAPERSASAGHDLVTSTTRAYVRGTGTVQLPGAPQAVRLVTSLNGDRSANSDDFILQARGPRLSIRPLPTPAPAAYANAVGDFTIKSTLSSLNAKVGESVTWTVELAGTGNWPEITKLPGRVVSKDFNAVAPVLKRTLKPASLFEGALSEDVVLVPTKAGEYQLGPVRYTYFDPKVGKYQMLVSETYTLTVGGRSTLDPAATSPDRYRPVNTAKTPIPMSPQPLPLDPLGPGWAALAPLTPAAQTAGWVAALALFLGYWLSLAAARARATDALASRRAARLRLTAVLAELDRAAPEADTLRRLIFAWQQATIDFAGLRLTTPTASQIATAIEGAPTGDTHGSSWALLWRESNAALYGQHGLLAPGWVLRAKAALSERTLPPVPLSAALAPRNLFPFLPKYAPVGGAPANASAASGSPSYLVNHKSEIAPTLASALAILLTLTAALGLATATLHASDNEASTPGATSAFKTTPAADAKAGSPAAAGANGAAPMSGASSAEGTALYLKGDFAGAAAAWRAVVEKTPLDASAHYNLALVAAQQNKWAESMAQSLAAFCLEPTNPAIRFQFEMALDRAGIDNPQLNPLIKKGSVRYTLAGRLSPGQWGLALILGALATALALAALLKGFYTPKSPAYRYTTGTLATLLLAFTIAAESSVKCYGQLADTQIAVVSRNTLLCSVPTEIDTTQKTVPLPAGSLAKIEKNFLGWSKLVFPNGQTGWIRTDAVVSLYH